MQSSEFDKGIWEKDSRLPKNYPFFYIIVTPFSVNVNTPMKCMELYKCINCIIYFIEAALKAMPAILWCQPTMCEADVGGMSAWVEPSCQLSYILLPCDRWQQRGSLT